MLTKEECLKALRYITDLYEELYITRLKESGNHIDDTKEYWLLEELINEHFSNKPLDFEELKEDMWVWDNKRKEWCKFLCCCVFEYLDGYDDEFEENRYYRKQVKE